MSVQRPGIEDLVALERRGSLDLEQEKRLERELSTSLVERVVHEAGREFDAHDEVQPGDSDLLARVAERVLVERRRAAPRPSWLRRLRTPLLAGVFAATAATVAAAAVQALTPRAVTTSVSDGRLVEVCAEVERTLGDFRHDLEPARPIDVPDVLPSASTPVKAANPRAGVPAPSSEPSASVEPAPPTAVTMFAEANAARRSGDVVTAIARYHELQAQFPGSSEAAVSRVSLGNLLLRRGQSAEALEQFQAYLASHSSGGLSEEALRGKADALGRLGRNNEARSTWQELLSRFPESAYADLARSHLD